MGQARCMHERHLQKFGQKAFRAETKRPLGRPGLRWRIIVK